MSHHIIKESIEIEREEADHDRVKNRKKGFLHTIIAMKEIIIKKGHGKENQVIVIIMKSVYIVMKEKAMIQIIIENPMIDTNRQEMIIRKNQVTLKTNSIQMLILLFQSIWFKILFERMKRIL